MSEEDWYRLTTWTEEDQLAFFARLKRSRDPFHKAQYTTTQALYLHGIGTKESSRWALELLDLVEKEWPEPSALASMHQQRAECYLTLEDLPKAIDCFRAALAQEKIFPGVQTVARFTFPYLIARRELVEHYDEALDTLELINDLAFPINTYLFNAAVALIIADRGNPEIARDRAIAALEACGLDHSGYPRHPKFGLVDKVDEDVVARLTNIANS